MTSSLTLLTRNLGNSIGFCIKICSWKCCGFL